MASIGAFNAPVLEHLPPIITSKIEPPPLRPTTLTRHRLLDRLPLTEPKRVTLIVADPGFGKTTLLADFSSRYPGRCVWYRLDETDRDWITLVNYVIAAFRQSVPSFGEATATLLTPITGALPSREAVLRTLLADMEAIADTPTAIVFDDFHTVEESPDATDLVTRLLRDAPRSVHILISTRRRPSIALARWFAAGEGSEVTTDDLRFSSAETIALFAQSAGQVPDPDVIDELDRRTHGWIASLQLFQSLVIGRSDATVRSLVRILSGANSPIYEFLAEEVVDDLAPPLQEFAIRSSILDSIEPSYVVALFGDDRMSRSDAAMLMADAEHAGIVGRITHMDEALAFHPLLKEFLLRRLRETLPDAKIAAMHKRVAHVAESADLILACRHYIDGGLPTEGMRCLARSVLQTMGSGRWGAASQLIERLASVPADAAVVAIRARRFVETGQLDAAASLLRDINVSALPPAIRAVIRNTRLSLDWRAGNADGILTTLKEVIADNQTPAALREIAQVYIDTSPLTPTPASLPSLSSRLEAMAKRQLADGHPFYAATSVHNAAVASLNAGDFSRAEQLGFDALEAYDRLVFTLGARYSMHTLLATTALERGRPDLAPDQIRLATSSDEAEGDVYGELGYVLAAIGDRTRALEFVHRAEAMERLGMLDMEGRLQTVRAQALLSMPSNPGAAFRLLETLPETIPLDLGYSVLADALRGVALLLLGDETGAAETCRHALASALLRGNGRGRARLAIVLALARRNREDICAAIAEANGLGELALLEVADAIGPALNVVAPVPNELHASMRAWPERWQPVLRRVLENGNTPAAHVAADLLDRYGAVEDIGRLRAFERTYRRGKRPGLGKSLAQRMAPQMKINDLGRGTIAIGDRQVAINRMRRKPAALLMYLVTRPNFTATREQVLEELWPDGDPVSGANSLNQSLHFLRRELDPWYEVDVSYDYIAFESELLWVDADVVSVASATFSRDCAAMDLSSSHSDQLLDLVRRYSGQFCPEFEYDEWAIAWRARVHAAYLDLGHRAIRQLVARGDVVQAREVAAAVLSVDPSAADIERKLVWLYAASGSQSAAVAQYDHLAAVLRGNEFEVPSLRDITSRPHPT